MRTSSSRGETTRGRGILAPFDPWNSPLCTCPFKLSLNPYTGCSFKCLYCYATAYIGQRDSTPKKDFLRRLKRELARWDPKLPINMGTSSDPYPPEEAGYGLTRTALELLVGLGRRVLITTKGVLYAQRDLDLISKGNVAVTPTITLLDPGLSLIIEPGAPPAEKRIDAVRRAVGAGVPVGVRIDPVIPYVNDDPAMLEDLVERVAEAGAVFIVTSTYKARPDNMARMRAALGSLGERIYRLYRSRGVRVGGYTYLPEEDRKRLLEPVVKAARRLGLQYAHCREGFRGREWFNAPSCDGTHLIPERVEPRAVRLDGWLH
ncbi:MAG: radical SAM protein [Desulfurococcales archaeon]|nr:radical SAM protein [Desulfurococcales archaeon]